VFCCATVAQLAIERLATNNKRQIPLSRFCRLFKPRICSSGGTPSSCPPQPLPKLRTNNGRLLTRNQRRSTERYLTRFRTRRNIRAICALERRRNNRGSVERGREEWEGAGVVAPVATTSNGSSFSPSLQFITRLRHAFWWVFRVLADILR